MPIVFLIAGPVPDTHVMIEHGQIEWHSTQVWKQHVSIVPAAFPLEDKDAILQADGDTVLVSDANVLSGDDVLGGEFFIVTGLRIWCGWGEPGLLSLGENIGTMKIVVMLPPSDLKEKGALPLTSKVEQLDLPSARLDCNITWAWTATKRTRIIA